MASNIAVRLVANGEALIAETSRSFNAIKANAKLIAQETGQHFSEDLQKGLREAEATARASFKSIGDIVSSATRTNGAIQFDVAGAKAAAAAAQGRLETLQALSRAHDAVISKEGQASAATRVYGLAIAENIREETQNIEILNAKAATLERLQGELSQTAQAQGRVTATSGQARAGMQQLSFQISDVATSFSAGINPMVIFAQQGSQVVQALGMMGTKTTGLLAILANPWFTVVLAAVTVLGSLVMKGDEATKTFDLLSGSVDLNKVSQLSLTASVKEAVAQLEKQNRSAAENARLQNVQAKVAKQTALANLDAAEAIIEQSAAWQVLNLAMNNGGNFAIALGTVKAMRDSAQQSINDIRKSIGSYDKLITLTSGNVTKELKKEEDQRDKTARAADRQAAAGERAAKAASKEAAERAKLTKFLSPVDGPVTSGYGKRVHPVTGKSDFHGGIDYGVGVGTGVRAPATGVVTEVGRKQHNGLFVKISHGAGTETMFLHLDKADVVEGQVLSAGEYFAKSGKSGRATGPHLDYRVLRNGSSVNPNSGPFPTDPSQFSALEAKHADDIEKSQERQIENHQRIIGQMQAQIDQNNTIMAVERLRAQGRDEEADVVAALAQLHAQYADVIKGTTENSAVELYLQRQRLAVLEKQTVEMARQKAANDNADFFGGVVEKAVEEGQKKIKQMQEDQAREQKRQFEDLATFWERAFSSGGKSIWADFKQMGRRVLSELAAQATISFLGNIGGGRSGGGIGGLFSGIGQMFGLGGSGQQGGSAAGFANLGALSANMGPVAAAVALNQTVGKLFGSDQIKHGGLLTALFGPLGLAFGSAKKGSATLGFADGTLGLGSTRGNSRSRIEGASNGINSIADMLTQVADALGGSISGAGSVSLGIRKKTYVVDPTGQGRTKGAGVLKFKDEQAAIEAAFRDALSDGVIAGISAASQRILQAGGNIDKAIEKAALIESIPKALKARLNPVGAALTELNDKWDKTIAALKEGGASAEQMADAEKLYRLEREEAMKAANDNLKEFIASLNYGPSSTYSLIDQQKAARADLETYLGKINSGDFAGVDQQRYLQLAQQYLDITREIDGSGTSWFSSVDELRNATQRLADGLSASTAEAARDPFAQINAANAESTAANTLATAEILAQQSGQLANIENYLAALASGEGVRGFIGAGRSFTEAA